MIYTHVSQRYNKIYFRGYRDGKRVQTSDAFYKPRLYLPATESTGPSSLYGADLRPVDFDSIALAKEWVRDNRDLIKIHGNDKYEYDFIHKNWSGEQTVSVSDLCVEIIDIETTVGNGSAAFPDVDDPEEEITLVSFKNYGTKKMVTFGCLPADVPGYVLCRDEADLLQRVVNYVVDTDPDIITGWNCVYFDIAYLVARSNAVIGERATQRLSPFNHVDRKVDKVMDREQTWYSIAGRSVLDMLDLYKKFRFINRPSYKLDYIGQVEIGKTKLKNPGRDFKDFYTNYWQTFVEYNQMDVHLVDELEDRLGMIYLAVTLAYLSKVNFDDVFSPVKTWENYILDTLRAENVFCELKKGNQDGTIVGGFVKSPTPGLYEWTGSFDATSLYPSIIMSLNMSPETLVDMIPDISSDELVLGNVSLPTSDFATAANGSRYSKESLGVLPRLTKHVFDARKAAKNRMLELKREYELTGEEATKRESARLHVLQLALKVKSNSLFGVTSNAYFLFFDNRIAEGITMTGQYIIQTVANKLNPYLATISGTPVGTDHVITMDTDSLYCHLGYVVEKHLANIRDDQKICDALMKICLERIAPKLDAITNKIGVDMNFYANRISFKLEAISRRSVFLAKKRNFQKVLDNEGVRYKTPDYKVTGIETNRSSTPDVVRGWLMDAIILILDEPNQTVLEDYVERRRSEFRSYPIEAIAFPRGVNNMRKYSDPEKIYRGGCPIAVRAALLYNNLLVKKNLGGKYPRIEEGSKIKFIYLREPNTLKEDVVGFIDTLPAEFGLGKYIDYDKQFDSVFLSPLTKITDALKWHASEGTSLMDLL